MSTRDSDGWDNPDSPQAMVLQGHDDLKASVDQILKDLPLPQNNGDEEHQQDEHPVLPETFWTARPALNHIRYAAQARGAAPDAVLGSVLAGVALRTSPEVVLPPIVGGKGSLNLPVGIIGRSGAGKGVAMRTGEDLLPELEGWAGVGPPGTGQGMTDVFFETVKVPDDEGKTIMEHRRRLEAYMFEADEGQVLAKLGEGIGSLTLETMRLSFNGERIGTTTVGAPWRQLRRHSYRMVWLLGFQPSIVRPLLADVAGGTPQRFVWFGIVDPDAPFTRPEHPGRLRLSIPETEPGRENVVRVAPHIIDEVWRRRHEVLTGQREPGLFESHRDLLRLKVGVLLGLLNGRATVTVDDWALASIVLDTSDAVREATLAHNRASDAREEAGRNVRAADRARAEEGARRSVNDNVTRVARTIARRLEREESRGVRNIRPMTRRQLRDATAGRDRGWVEPALDHAEAMGWAVQDDHGEYTLGPSWTA